jgi:excisionase family DNA binding protein
VTPTSLPPADAPAAQLLDVEQVAAILNCSVRHVYRLSDAGRMPPRLRLGSLVRWRRQDIDTWLADGCPPCRRAGRQDGGAAVPSGRR